MPTSAAIPLKLEEQQKLLALLTELRSRGREMPEDYQNLLNPETVKDVKWRLGGNGYFLKDDGSQYKPAPQQEAFIKSTARFVMGRGGRGSGKSAAGAQKANFKIKDGEDGAVINPVFSDFKTST